MKSLSYHILLTETLEQSGAIVNVSTNTWFLLENRKLKCGGKKVLLSDHEIYEA